LVFADKHERYYNLRNEGDLVARLRSKMTKREDEPLAVLNQTYLGEIEGSGIGEK